MSIAYELTPCIACGERESTFLVDTEGLRAERERLWAFHLRRLSADTPPRYLADRLAFSQPDALRLVQCRHCAMVYRNPIERAHVVLDTYAGDTPASDVLEGLHATQREASRAQARRLTRIAGRAGRVLEVGSFVGGFLAAAREQGWDARGVDVNPTVNAWVRTRRHAVHDGTLAEVPPEPPVDVVAFWNCFDQLADPPASLRDARDRLLPGGRVVLRVPNGECYARLRSRRTGVAEGILAMNNLLGFPYRYGFGPRSIAHALQRAGFRVERIVADTLVPTADRFTRGWAHLEERVAKGVVRTLARRGLVDAPWIEVYARRE